MKVNNSTRFRFSNPYPISDHSSLVGRLSDRLSMAKVYNDFASYITKDKSKHILTKKNIGGLRR